MSHSKKWLLEPRNIFLPSGRKQTDIAGSPGNEPRRTPSERRNRSRLSLLRTAIIFSSGVNHASSPRVSSFGPRVRSGSRQSPAPGPDPQAASKFPLGLNRTELFAPLSKRRTTLPVAAFQIRTSDSPLVSPSQSFVAAKRRSGVRKIAAGWLPTGKSIFFSGSANGTRENFPTRSPYKAATGRSPWISVIKNPGRESMSSAGPISSFASFQFSDLFQSPDLSPLKTTASLAGLKTAVFDSPGQKGRSARSAPSSADTRCSPFERRLMAI